MWEVNHIPVLTHFLKVVQPTTSFELGCGPNTTPYLDQMTIGWVNSFHSNRHSIQCFKKEYDQSNLQRTDISLYDTVYSLRTYLLDEEQRDFFLIGGPVKDRLDVAQMAMDTAARCIILLDYHFEDCNYRKLRDNVGYSFRSFNNYKVGGETGVLLLNTLRFTEILDHA